MEFVDNKKNLEYRRMHPKKNVKKIMKDWKSGMIQIEEWKSDRLQLNLCVI